MRVVEIVSGMTIHGLRVERVVPGPCVVDVPGHGEMRAQAGQVVVVYEPSRAAVADAERRSLNVERAAAEMREALARQLVSVTLDAFDGGPEVLHAAVADTVAGLRATLNPPEASAERAVSVFDVEAEVLP